jgi:WD40 repeat protein
VTLATVTIMLGLVGNLATNMVEVRRWWWAPLLWGLTGVLVAAALIVEWRGRAEPTTDDFPAGLAESVRRQWQAEAVLRRLVPKNEVTRRPRVFVCYAHENPGHKAMVLNFAEFLRRNDVDVVLDQLAEDERRDWDVWMRQAIRGSRYVLVIASDTVRRVGDGDMPDGVRGLRAELNLLRDLYNGEPQVWPKRILPVLLPGRSISEIPSFLQPHNADHYIVMAFTVTGAERLLRQLVEVPTAPRAESGTRPALPPRVARHWVVSARGTDLSATEFWFTGRRHALALISDFTRDRQPGILAVTGMPGAGKSALLGVCVLRSLAPDTLPPEIRSSIPDCSINVAVHARGKEADTVLAEVAECLDGTPRNVAEVRDLLDEIIDPDSPPVCVIDALDEAKDPGGVADAVRWLSARAVTIVGVRPDAPAGPGGPVLPTALRPRHPVVIDLDATEHMSDRDVAAYVAQRLRADATRPGGYGTLAWDMDVLVDVIGAEIHDEVAAGNFLIAQLVVEELLAMPVVAARRRGWSNDLDWPEQLQDWIRRDMRRRLGESAATEARSTLAPVAHALRGGLTVDLWRALIPRFGLGVNPDTAIAGVTTQLGFYLTSPAPGRFAIRHEQFAGYFAAGLPAGRGDDIFVDILTDGVPRSGDGRLDWAHADEYTALNLLAHAHGAGRLGAVIKEQPACLARVDPLSAGTLLATATEPWCRAAADVLRRAAYASSAGYGQRAAALQAHAALAGHDHLASTLLSQAEARMPWTVRWSAGTPDNAPVAVGGVYRTQAVVTVAAHPDDPPSMIVVRTDGSCSLRDAVSGQALASDIVIESSDDEVPILRAWQTLSGPVYLAVGRHDGQVTVWTLTGRSAGSVVWRCSAGPQLRDLARAAGPQGTDLIVILAGGTLTARPLRPFEASGPTTDTLLHITCPASRVLPLAPTDRTAAFLTTGADADLTAWRISSQTHAVESTVHPAPCLRTDTIIADGDADRACVLSNAEQAVHSTWLTARLRTAGSHQRLHDGGRTARIALAVHAEVATAAVADGSAGVHVFDLPPDAPAAPISRHDTDDPVYHLAFVDRQATMLAVGGWPGTVAVLNAREPGRPGMLRIGHGESGVTVHPLGQADRSWLMATRGLNGLTRVWQLPSASASPAAEEPPVSSLCSVPTDDGRLLVVAASAGYEIARCWSADPGRHRADPLPTVTHPGGVSAMVCARVGGRAWLATAGESGTTLWAVNGDGLLRVEAATPTGHPDVEHVILGAGPDNRLILGTAGPEHLQLWSYDGEMFTAVVTSEDDWITALAVEQLDDRMFVATGDDDGAVRLIELSTSGSASIQTVHEGDAVLAVAVLATDGRGTVFAADRYGALAVGTTGDDPAPTIDSIPWQVTHLIATSAAVGGRLFGVASTPPRLLSWLPDHDGDLRLERPLGELRGTPLHVARTASAVAVADGGGQLLLVDAVTVRVTAANLNITVDALAGVPGTGMFVAARGGRLICFAANADR